MLDFNLDANSVQKCTITIPVRNNDGKIVYMKDADRIERVAMIEPEMLRELGRPLKGSLADKDTEALAIFNQALKNGRAKLSQIPRDGQQRRKLKAASSANPYETDWQTLDTMIRTTDNQEEENEMLFLRSLGLVTDDLTWGDWEIKNIIREPMKMRKNDRWAYGELNPETLNDPFSTRFGTDSTIIDVNFNTFITGARPSTQATDDINAGDAARSTLLQQNYNVLYGGNGISLADPGKYWAGLLNSPQQVSFDNTLDGAYAPPGVYFNSSSGIEAVLKFVRKQFRLSKKYGNFAAIFGDDIPYELATTIGDNKTDSVTLSTVMENLARTLNKGQELRWTSSLKIPADPALFFVTDPMYNKFRTAGGLNVFELNGNNLGRTGFVNTIEVFIAPGNGVDGDISIIYITGLLPVPA